MTSENESTKKSIVEWLTSPNTEWIRTIITLPAFPEWSFWMYLLGLFVIYKVLDRLVRIPYIGDYSQRYVLVTGAARGFGHDAVLRLDALGCHVFAGVRNSESADKIRSICSARVDPVILDITSDEQVQAALKYISSKLPAGRGLWGVVNNAATLLFSDMEWTVLGDYEEAVQTNIIGTIRVTSAFLPLIKKARGRIVNVTSIGGRLSANIFAPYSISKYGVESYSDGLRRVMRKHGVKVLIVEPGTFKTDILTNAGTQIAQTWERVPNELKKELGEKSLQGALRSRELIEMFSSTRISDVSESYIHALLGRFPRARYAVGLDCALIYKPLIFLPEWLSDYLLGFFM